MTLGHRQTLRIANRLSEKIGTGDLRLAAKLAANQFQHSYPVGGADLKRIMELRKVKRVKASETLGAEGYLFPCPDRVFEICLRSTMSIPHRRFVLAHEVGHTWFFEWSLGSWMHCVARNSDDSRAEEIFCDLFAAALLVPGESFNGTDTDVDDLASRYSVSHTGVLVAQELYRPTLPLEIVR